MVGSNYHTEQAFRARMAQREKDPRVPRPFEVFYHIAAMYDPYWKDIVREQLADMIQAGISKDLIRTCVLGDSNAVIWVRNLGLNVVGDHRNLQEYECFTLQRVYDFAINYPEGAVLYLHTKGASAPWDAQKIAWRRLMMECVVKRWKENLNLLSTADMVGVAWIHSRTHPHYSGNIWMARCDWLASLPVPLKYRNERGPVIAGNPWQRMAAEMWIGSRPWHKMHCLALENTCLMGDAPLHGCYELGIPPRVEPPTIHVITPVSRPEGLAKVHASLHHVRYCRIQWHVILDPAIVIPKRPVCSCVATWQAGETPRALAGHAHRNRMLRILRETADPEDWIYFLDDDNLWHPGLEEAFLDSRACHPTAQWFVFGQQFKRGKRRLAPTDKPQVGKIDTGQCLWKLRCLEGLGRDVPFREDLYEADGYFYEDLARSVTPIAINRDVTYYNALR